MLRVGIVGFGFMGRMHYKCWQAMGDAAVVAICDSNPNLIADANKAVGNIEGAADHIDFEKLEVFSDFDTEGRVYEGWMLADPDVGVFSWTGDIHGPNVTVTMRDASNNTSEFSLPWEAACPHSTYLPVVYKHD